MFSLLTLFLFFLVALPVLLLFALIFSVPLFLFMAFLPWILRLFAFILLLRALFDHPFHTPSLLPALLLFGVSLLLQR